MLIGIPGDLTYANYQEANRAFCRLTVLPLIARTAAALSNWFRPAYGAGIRLDFDADRLPGLSAEREALWARVGAADFLSDAEKREAVGTDFPVPATGWLGMYRDNVGSMASGAVLIAAYKLVAAVAHVA